jgi:acyl carrier protein
VTDREQIIQNIKQIVIRTANLIDKPLSDIDENMPLFASGLGLDSVDLLELVIALDKTFGLKIKNDETGRAVLSSIASIADAVSTI